MTRTIEISVCSLAEADPAQREAWYDGADRIFWETAEVDSFETTEAREQFRYKYIGYYRDAAPDLFLVAITRTRDHARDDAGDVYGYICGVADTRAHPELYRVAAHIPVFDDLYDRYPAHLHINLTARSRGHGIGSTLIAALEDHLRTGYATPGLHLVTSEGARNVSFYRKNGFFFEMVRGMPEKPDTHPAEPRMLFMGKELG